MVFQTIVSKPQTVVLESQTTLCMPRMVVSRSQAVVREEKYMFLG